MVIEGEKSVASKSEQLKAELKRMKKKKQDQLNKGDGDLSDYAADELDLTKDLYSLEHYLEKPEEMIEQTFNVVRGGKLSAMLPPILKDIPIEDLKELCLTELKKLSVDDVKGILEGKHFSRDSDGGSDQSGGEGGPTKSGPPQVKKEDSPEPEFGKGFKRVEKKAITIKTLCLPNDDELMGTTPSSPPKQETDKGEGGAIKMDAIEKDLDGRTLMELLELEMRAKALRQLIESKDSDEEAGAGQEKSTAKKRFRSHRASSSSNDGSSTSSSSSSESGSDSSATRRKKKKKKRKKRRKQKKREKEARKELARIETTREESLEEGEAQSDDDVWKDIMAGGDRQAGSPIAPTDAHPDAAESEVDPEKKVVTESVEPPPAALPKVVKKEPARSPVASSTPPETVSTPPTTAVRSEILDAGTIGSPLKEVVAEKDKEPEEEGEIEGGEEEEIPLDEHGQPIPEFRGWSKTEEDLKRIERALDEYEAKVKAEEKERQEIVVPEGSFQKEERVRQTMEEYTQRLQELELSVENFKGQIFRMAVRDEEQGSRLVELEEGFNKFRREIFKYKETLNTELEEEFREHAEENPVILEAMDRVDELVKRSRKSKDSMMTLKRFYEAKREELTLKAESSKKKVEEVVKEPPPKEPEVEEKMETEVLEQETAQVPEQETDEVPEQETDQVPVQEAKESKPEESPLSPEKEPVEAKEERKSNSPVATQKQAGEEDTTELPEAFTTIDEVTEDVDETTADAESIPASVDASPAPSALLDENSATGDGTSDIPDDAGEGTVVEPSKEDDLTNLTWASRWVTSEKVKKVVSASKIFSKVRKKFKTEKKQQSAAASPASSSPQVGMSASGAVSSTYSSAKKRPTLTFGNITGSLHQNFEEVGSVVGPSSAVTVKEEPQEHHKTHLPTVIGSIEEYERLFGKHVKMEHEKKPDEESKEKGKEEKQKKADGEDSEEEDLWSQIMGGDDSD